MQQRIQVGLEFEPYSENWEAWCKHALKFLKENKECGAQLTYSAEHNGFVLTGIPGVDREVWFSLKPHYFHQWVGFLAGWTMLLGPDAGFHPIAVSRRMQVSGQKIDGLELRLEVRGTASQVGLYRILAQILMKHEYLTEGDMVMLKSVHDTLLDRRRAKLDGAAVVD